MIGYPLRMTERDSWSGPSPDGYLVFDSEVRRAEYVYEQTKDRTGAAPDYYIQYDFEQPMKLSEASIAKFKDGKFYVDQLYMKVKMV